MTAYGFLPTFSNLIFGREGIVFALEGDNEDGKPNNVSFLEVLIEFSNKLMRQDKLAV